MARTSDLLRAPGARPMVLASLLARLPLGMTGLAELLLVRGAGWSYAQTGAVLAAYTVCSSAAAPAQGRLIDRFGQRVVLLPLAVLFPAATVALLALTRNGAPPGVLAVAAGLAGLTLPPISACTRAIWPDLLPDPDLRAAAFALEATLQELFFIGGPLLVVVLVRVGSPSLAVGAIAALGFFGTLSFASTPGARSRGRAGREHVTGGGWARALTPGVRTVLTAGVVMGIAFGTVEVAMPAFAEHHGARSAGGYALAAFSAGSLVGGLIAVALPRASDPPRRLRLVLALFAAGLALPLLASSIPAVVVLIFFAGLPIAPAFAVSYGLIDALAPPHTTTEAFAWISTSVVAGVGCGTASAGVLVSRAGVPAALVLAVGAVALGAVAVTVRRRTLVA